MSERISIDGALCDPNLLGAALGDLASWKTWRVALKGAFGIALNREEARTFAAIAGSRKPPGQRVRELWCIIGRRSGKSRIAALVGAFIAGLADHRGKLSPGEIGTVLILAASKAQAATVFNCCRAFFEASPLMSQLVEETTADEIRLRGNIVLAVHTNNYRTVRGRTLLACIFDEAGFWRDENSSQPDVETYRAILPSLATTGGMLIAISSPYAQRGLL
jgi:phage terminase large subunit-like protein